MKKNRENDFIVKEFRHEESTRNEYLLINDNEAAVIDISLSCDDVCRFLRGSDIKLKYLLITHAHKSHLEALPKIKEEFGGIFCFCKEDLDLLESSGVNIEPDQFVSDKDKLMLGQGTIRVLHTPGHTDGSLCFYVKSADLLFSGRTIEKDGYGTIWGPLSMARMIRSLKRLNFNVYSATIYPGRGEKTTMKEESWMNCLRSH